MPWQQQIRRELLESQLKVASLQDMSCQLLVNAEGKDCLEAKEKVHVIGNRLKLLLKEVTRHIKDLEKILDISTSQLVSHVFLFLAVCWAHISHCFDCLSLISAVSCTVSVVCNAYQDGIHVVLNIIK